MAIEGNAYIKIKIVTLINDAELTHLQESSCVEFENIPNL